MDYLSKYGKPSVQKFQAGGATPAQPEQGGIEQAIMQVVQTQDPQLALQVVNQLAQQMGLTGGQAPVAAGDAGGAPADQGGAPMGRYGLKTPVFPKK